MKFKDYDIEHFLSDEFFVQWVKNPDENNRHFWEKWIMEHPEKRSVVQQAASIIRAVQPKHKLDLTDTDYLEMFENIIKADDKIEVEAGSVKKQSGWFSFFSIRGIAAVFALGFCMWITYEVMTKASAEAESLEITMVSKSNPAGKKSIIKLAEGSKIHLNSESSITYPEVFEHDQRTVRLEGEAYFEVAKDGRPFMVLVGNNVIQVLGTSFNVSQRDNGGLSVALVEGKVQVNDKIGNQVLLDPNEMLVIEQNGSFYKSGFDVLEVVGWKDMYLVFESDNIDQVKQKLKRWFGVEIEVKGQIEPNWKYSGKFKDESLENVLRGISITSGLKYKIEGKNVLIYKY